MWLLTDENSVIRRENGYMIKSNIIDRPYLQKSKSKLLKRYYGPFEIIQRI